MIRKFCSRRKLAIGKTEIREFECCGWRPSGGRSVFAGDTGLKGALNRGKAIEEKALAAGLAKRAVSDDRYQRKSDVH